ncbi:MAG: MotE family protein [Neorhizobium sp.]|nr:MotE family protein [Neorhizobium sp.]
MTDQSSRDSLIGRLAPYIVLTGLAVLGSLPSARAQQNFGPMSDQNSGSEIKQYCGNIVDAARDQRYALQKQDLDKLQADINDRIAMLDKRKVEYQDWLKKRDDFMKRADQNLVDVYKTMKPDDAAPQFENMDIRVAAAIIMKLPSRQSGLILSGMDAKKAANIATIMSNAGLANTSRDPS